MSILAFDTETTGLGPLDRAFGASYCVTGGQSGYVDLRSGDRHELFRLIFDTDLRIVCHNASFDYRMMRNVGVILPVERMDDTVIRATLINEHETSYSLDSLSDKYLGRKKDTDVWPILAQMFGGPATRAAQITRLVHAPVDLVARYAIPDAELAHDLWMWQEGEIAKQGIQKIVEFERRLMPRIIDNEVRGIRVDVEAAERARAGLTRIIENQQAALFNMAGRQFNVNSPKDMEILFAPTKQDGVWRARDGSIIPATPGGKPSFSADAMRDIGSSLSNAIIEVRSLIKTRDTFINGHILGNQINGRVYPSIHQTKGEDGGTGTGRFSYSEPAMQQIPSRNKDVARVIKPIFLPDEGQVWVDGDMHSFEVRAFAHLVNNEEINEIYRNNPETDFHQMVADMTNLPRAAQYSGQANAKQLNLSMIFNSGNGAIADKMGMPFHWDSFTDKAGKLVNFRRAGEEAMAVIDAYHRRLPGIKELADRAKRKAETFGYVETHYGRRLRFPRRDKSYKASGLAIQATSADINKMNWILISEALGGAGRLILNTHDSYSLSLPEEWEPHWRKVKESVESGHPWFRVPLILELSGAGPNWWAALGK